MVQKFSYFIVFFTIGLTTYYFYPAYPIDSSKNIDKILVEKSKRKLTLYSNGLKVKTYTISLGRCPKGHKQFEGDKKTPEGIYYINDKNPQSAYHLNLGISYPNKKDVRFAEERGKSPGGAIKIHGLRNGLGFIGKFHRFFDWTLGCIALTNKEIEELYDKVSVGTIIEIKQ